MATWDEVSSQSQEIGSEYVQTMYQHQLSLREQASLIIDNLDAQTIAQMLQPDWFDVIEEIAERMWHDHQKTSESLQKLTASEYANFKGMNVPKDANLPEVMSSFGVYDRRAVEWLQDYNFELIQRIKEDIRYGIKGSVMQGVAIGEDNQQIANRIRRYVTKPMPIYRKADMLLVEEGKKTIKEIRPIRFISPEHRSMMIARTESMRVFNQANKSQYLENGIEKVELSKHPGECPFCVMIRNQGPWETGRSPYLPLHPFCRHTYLPIVDVNALLRDLRELGGQNYSNTVGENPFTSGMDFLGDWKPNQKEKVRKAFDSLPDHLRNSRFLDEGLIQMDPLQHFGSKIVDGRHVIVGKGWTDERIITELMNSYGRQWYGRYKLQLTEHFGKKVDEIRFGEYFARYFNAPDSIPDGGIRDFFEKVVFRNKFEPKKFEPSDVVRPIVEKPKAPIPKTFLDAQYGANDPVKFIDIDGRTWYAKPGSKESMEMEKAVWELANDLGVRTYSDLIIVDPADVPKSVLEHGSWGSRKYLEGVVFTREIAGESVARSLLDSDHFLEHNLDEIRKISALDILVGNTDRHFGNFMYDYSHLYAIDHGDCGYKDYVTNYFLNDMMSKATTRAGFDDWYKATFGDILDQFDRLDLNKWKGVEAREGEFIEVLSNNRKNFKAGLKETMDDSNLWKEEMPSKLIIRGEDWEGRDDFIREYNLLPEEMQMGLDIHVINVLDEHSWGFDGDTFRFYKSEDYEDAFREYIEHKIWPHYKDNGFIEYKSDFTDLYVKYLHGEFNIPYTKEEKNIKDFFAGLKPPQQDIIKRLEDSHLLGPAAEETLNYVYRIEDRLGDIWYLKIMPGDTSIEMEEAAWGLAKDLGVKTYPELYTKKVGDLPEFLFAQLDDIYQDMGQDIDLDLNVLITKNIGEGSTPLTHFNYYDKGETVNKFSDLINEYGDEDIRRMFFFDILSGNQDRNWGNIIHLDDNLYAIDHEFTWNRFSAGINHPGMAWLDKKLYRGDFDDWFHKEFDDLVEQANKLDFSRYTSDATQIIQGNLQNIQTNMRDFLSVNHLWKKDPSKKMFVDIIGEPSRLGDEQFVKLAYDAIPDHLKIYDDVYIKFSDEPTLSLGDRALRINKDASPKNIQGEIWDHFAKSIFHEYQDQIYPYGWNMGMFGTIFREYMEHGLSSTDLKEEVEQMVKILKIKGDDIQTDFPKIKKMSDDTEASANVVVKFTDIDNQDWFVKVLDDETDIDAELLGWKLAQDLNIKTYPEIRLAHFEDMMENESKIPDEIRDRFDFLDYSDERLLVTKAIPVIDPDARLTIMDLEKYPDDVKKVFVMDMISGNADRHLGNLLVGEDGLYAIDHGYIFHPETLCLPFSKLYEDKITRLEFDEWFDSNLKPLFDKVDLDKFENKVKNLSDINKPDLSSNVELMKEKLENAREETRNFFEEMRMFRPTRRTSDSPIKLMEIADKIDFEGDLPKYFKEDMRQMFQLLPPNMRVKATFKRMGVRAKPEKDELKILYDIKGTELLNSGLEEYARKVAKLKGFDEDAFVKDLRTFFYGDEKALDDYVRKLADETDFYMMKKGDPEDFIFDLEETNGTADLYRELSFTEVNAIDNYPAYHEVLNTLLFSDKEMTKEIPGWADEFERKWWDTWLDQKKSLEDSMEKLTTQQDYIVFRGGDPTDWGAKKVGDIEHIRGYMSTSFNKEIANNYDMGAWNLEVHVPKGTHAIHRDGVMKASKLEISGGYQAELLLNRNTNLQILDIDKKNKKVIVQVVDRPSAKRGMGEYTKLDEMEKEDAKRFFFGDEKHTLPDVENSGIAFYKNLGYEEINDFFRWGEVVNPSIDPDIIENVFIPEIDNLMRKNRVPEDIIVHRQLGKSEKWANLEVGSLYADKSYLSTTLDPDFEKLGSPIYKPNAWTADILVPKGTRGIYVDGLDPLLDTGEKELLLPHGLDMQILSKDPINKKIIFEVVDSTDKPYKAVEPPKIDESYVTLTKRKLFNEYKDKVDLSEKERDALAGYKTTSYEDINHYLRNPTDEPLPIALDEDMQYIDAAISRSTLSNDTIIYRGASNKWIKDYNKVGDELVDNGFMSTSVDLGVANEFKKDKDGWFVKIYAPKGSNALPVEAGLKIDEKDLGDKILGEGELLLPYGSKFQILDINKDTKDAILMLLPNDEIKPHEFTGFKTSDLIKEGRVKIEPIKLTSEQVEETEKLMEYFPEKFRDAFNIKFVSDDSLRTSYQIVDLNKPGQYEIHLNPEYNIDLTNYRIQQYYGEILYTSLFSSNPELRKLFAGMDFEDASRTFGRVFEGNFIADNPPALTGNLQKELYKWMKKELEVKVDLSEGKKFDIPKEVEISPEIQKQLDEFIKYVPNEILESTPWKYEPKAFYDNTFYKGTIHIKKFDEVKGIGQMAGKMFEEAILPKYEEELLKVAREIGINYPLFRREFQKMFERYEEIHPDYQKIFDEVLRGIKVENPFKDVKLDEIFDDFKIDNYGDGLRVRIQDFGPKKMYIDPSISVAKQQEIVSIFDQIPEELRMDTLFRLGGDNYGQAANHFYFNFDMSDIQTPGFVDELLNKYAKDYLRYKYGKGQLLKEQGVSEDELVRYFKGESNKVIENTIKSSKPTIKEVNGKEWVSYQNSIDDAFKNLQVKKITSEEIEAVGSFQSRVGANILNPYLRNGELLDPDMGKKKLGRLANQIDNALQKQSLTENVIVERQWGETFFKGAKIGDVKKDKGFVSTAMTNKLFDDMTFAEGYHVKILIPKGAQAAPIDVLSNVSPFGVITNQSEILINRNTNFQFLDIDHKKKTAILEVKVDSKKVIEPTKLNEQEAMDLFMKQFDGIPKDDPNIKEFSMWARPHVQKGIADYLRGKGDGLVETPTGDLFDVRDTLKAIDMNIKRTVIPQDVIVYRGAGTFYDDKKVGDIFTEKAFTSTTFDKETAEQYAIKGQIEHYTAKIIVPEGTHGAYLDAFARKYVGFDWPLQQLLLDKGLTFQVLEKNEKTKEIILQVIDSRKIEKKIHGFKPSTKLDDKYLVKDSYNEVDNLVRFKEYDLKSLDSMIDQTDEITKDEVDLLVKYNGKGNWEKFNTWMRTGEKQYYEPEWDEWKKNFESLGEKFTLNKDLVLWRYAGRAIERKEVGDAFIDKAVGSTSVLEQWAKTFKLEAYDVGPATPWIAKIIVPEGSHAIPLDSTILKGGGFPGHTEAEVILPPGYVLQCIDIDKDKYIKTFVVRDATIVEPKLEIPDWVKKGEFGDQYTLEILNKSDHKEFLNYIDRLYENKVKDKVDLQLDLPMGWSEKSAFSYDFQTLAINLDDSREFNLDEPIGKWFTKNFPERKVEKPINKVEFEGDLPNYLKKDMSQFYKDLPEELRTHVVFKRMGKTTTPKENEIKIIYDIKGDELREAARKGLKEHLYKTFPDKKKLIDDTFGATKKAEPAPENIIEPSPVKGIVLDEKLSPGIKHDIRYNTDRLSNELTLDVEVKWMNKKEEPLPHQIKIYKGLKVDDQIKVFREEYAKRLFEKLKSELDPQITLKWFEKQFEVAVRRTGYNETLTKEKLMKIAAPPKRGKIESSITGEFTKDRKNQIESIINTLEDNITDERFKFPIEVVESKYPSLYGQFENGRYQIEFNKDFKNPEKIIESYSRGIYELLTDELKRKLNYNFSEIKTALEYQVKYGWAPEGRQGTEIIKLISKDKPKVKPTKLPYPQAFEGQTIHLPKESEWAIPDNLQDWANKFVFKDFESAIISNDFGGLYSLTKGKSSSVSIDGVHMKDGLVHIHYHPNGTAYPSQADLRAALLFPKVKYYIMTEDWIVKYRPKSNVKKPDISEREYRRAVDTSPFSPVDKTRWKNIHNGLKKAFPIFDFELIPKETFFKEIDDNNAKMATEIKKALDEVPKVKKESKSPLELIPNHFDVETSKAITKEDEWLNSKNITELQEQMKTLPHEVMAHFNKKGEILYTSKGDDMQVNWDSSSLPEADAIVHNHPGTPLGFSPGDISGSAEEIASGETFKDFVVAKNNIFKLEFTDLEKFRRMDNDIWEDLTSDYVEDVCKEIQYDLRSFNPYKEAKKVIQNEGKYEGLFDAGGNFTDPGLYNEYTEELARVARRLADDLQTKSYMRYINEMGNKWGFKVTRYDGNKTTLQELLTSKASKETKINKEVPSKTEIRRAQSPAVLEEDKIQNEKIKNLFTGLPIERQEKIIDDTWLRFYNEGGLDDLDMWMTFDQFETKFKSFVAGNEEPEVENILNYLRKGQKDRELQKTDKGIVDAPELVTKIKDIPRVEEKLDYPSGISPGMKFKDKNNDIWYAKAVTPFEASSEEAGYQMAQKLGFETYPEMKIAKGEIAPDKIRWAKDDVHIYIYTKEIPNEGDLASKLGVSDDAIAPMPSRTDMKLVGYSDDQIDEFHKMLELPPEISMEFDKEWALLHKDEYVKLFALDCALGNQDRHLSNVLYRDGKFLPIDHGILTRVGIKTEETFIRCDPMGEFLEAAYGDYDTMGDLTLNKEQFLEMVRPEFDKLRRMDLSVLQMSSEVREMIEYNIEHLDELAEDFFDHFQEPSNPFGNPFGPTRYM